MEQDPAAPGDSPTAGQEPASGTDPNQRINGLMRLVGQRTTALQQEKARADQAEADLAAALEALQAYESGAQMSDDEAAELVAEEDDSAMATAEDDEVTDGGSWATPTLEIPQQGDADTGDDYWWPNALRSGVDPNAASRASSMTAFSPTQTQQLQAQFENELGPALERWGVDGSQYWDGASETPSD